MRIVDVSFILMFFPVTCMAHNDGLTNVMKSCLFQKPLSKDIGYTTIDKNEVITDDDYRSLGSASYITYRNNDMGYAEKNNQGVIFFNKKAFPLKDATIIETGTPVKNKATNIEYLISEWAEISTPKGRYICVNYPFSGTGESGKHQYIRNALVFKENGGRNKLYYTVGNTEKQLANIVSEK